MENTRNLIDLEVKTLDGRSVIIKVFPNPSGNKFGERYYLDVHKKYLTVNNISDELVLKMNYDEYKELYKEEMKKDNHQSPDTKLSTRIIVATIILAIVVGFIIFIRKRKKQ